MKKYFAKDGHEISVGDSVHVEIGRDGEIELITSSKTTKELIEYLVSRGAVTVKDISEPPYNIEYYIGKLQNRLELDDDAFMKMSTALKKKSPISLFSMLAKQIAMEVDKKYDGHIIDSETLFTIAGDTGNVVKYVVPEDGSYTKNFPLFRTKEDADFAIKVLKPLYDIVFD